MTALLNRFRERKLVQWALAYLAGAWLLLQVLDLLSDAFGWPAGAQQIAIVLLAVGFFAALVLAWYHGEKGQQRVSGPELLMLSALLVIAGGVVWLIGRGDAEASGTITARAGAVPGQATPASTLTAERSIAVLPFDNLSESKENEYFSDGITDEILTTLANVGELRVISRTSVMQYKGTSKPLRQIASELGVAHILEGSVQRSGNQVRITAQLIDAKADVHLWAQRYDRPLKDVFAVQSEIAQEIAAALQTELSPAERRRIEAQPTENLAAYDLYLRGRELYNQDREANETAIELFKQALRLDSTFAPAHAWLARAYGQRMQIYGFPPAWADSGVAVAKTAISLEPNLADGHSALGLNYSMLGRLREANEAGRRALALNPSLAVTYTVMARDARTLGQHDQALLLGQRAVSLDPLSPFGPHHTGANYWYLGDDARAERWLQKSMQIRPNFFGGQMFLIYLHLSRGNTRAATEAARRWLETSPNNPIALTTAGDAALATGDFEQAARYFGQLLRILPDGRHLITYRSFRTHLATALLKTGERERARVLLDQAVADARRELDAGHEAPGIPLEVGIIHLLRGEKDAGYRWLERAVDAGWRDLRLMRLDPAFESVRHEPRFQRLLDRINTDLQVQRERLARKGRW